MTTAATTTRNLNKRTRWWDEDDWTPHFDDPCDDADFFQFQKEALADGWRHDPYGSSAGETYILAGYVRYTDSEAQYLQLCWYDQQ